MRIKGLTKLLRESNAIENVFDKESLRDATYAWNVLTSGPGISESDILLAHKILMKNQDLEEKYKGDYRDFNVAIKYTNALGRVIKMEPTGVRSKDVALMTKLWVSKANSLVDNRIQYRKRRDELEEIIRQHHIEFEGIHPFADGNGRIGRMLLNYERLLCEFPLLIIYNKDKRNYYQWFKKNEVDWSIL